MVSTRRHDIETPHVDDVQASSRVHGIQVSILIPFWRLCGMDSVYLEIACDTCDTVIINITATKDQNPKIDDKVDYACPKRGCGSKTCHVVHVYD